MTACQESKPVPQLGYSITRQKPLMRSGVRNDEKGCLRQPQPLQTGDEIPAHFGQDRRRHPIENHADGGLASSGLLQGHPGCLVAVSRRGGDEEPQVGGLQQPARQRPIGLVNGVQVRSVDERQTRRDGSGHLLTTDLCQRVFAERIHVLGVGHQDRDPSGGP